MTLCVPIAMAPDRPAKMPCQSLAPAIGGPATRRTVNTASSAVSNASIHGKAAPPCWRTQPISPAVKAAATTNATMAMSLPAMPVSWATSSAAPMTKLPVTWATNSPNSARNV